MDELYKHGAQLNQHLLIVCVRALVYRLDSYVTFETSKCQRIVVKCIRVHIHFRDTCKAFKEYCWSRVTAFMHAQMSELGPCAEHAPELHPGQRPTAGATGRVHHDLHESERCGLLCCRQELQGIVVDDAAREGDGGVAERRVPHHPHGTHETREAGMMACNGHVLSRDSQPPERRMVFEAGDREQGGWLREDEPRLSYHRSEDDVLPCIVGHRRRLYKLQMSNGWVLDEL
jgi:hypothetical protein